MMKQLLLTAAACALFTTAASAETIYMTYHSTKLWTAPAAFVRAYVSGNVDKAPQSTKEGDKVIVPVVTAQPAATQGKLVIETALVAPGSYLVARREILLLDANDNVVAELTVVVTPTGWPMRDVDMLADGSKRHFLCGHDPVRNSEDCIPAHLPKDPTAVTTFTAPGGIRGTRREY